MKPYAIEEFILPYASDKPVNLLQYAHGKFQRTKPAHRLIMGIGVLFVGSLLFIALNHWIMHPTVIIDTIHCINLDKDAHRWRIMQDQAQSYNISMMRWPAVYGKDLKYDQLRDLGIGHAMARSDRFDLEHKNLRNLGIIGCFITVRRLLQHLYSMTNVHDSHGHMIIEDDVVLPPDLMKPDGLLAQKIWYIPADWDLVYLGLWHPAGEAVYFPRSGVIKLRSQDQKNVGTFAYIVKHGSIPKILDWLTYMIDAIDEQFTLKFNEWNAYALVPNYVIMNVPLNDQSSINEINDPSKPAAKPTKKAALLTNK